MPVRIRRLPAVATSGLILALAALGCDPGEVEIQDLEVVDNPDNVLSAWVRWTTDRPATSRIEFGEGAPDRYASGSDEAVTDHEVLLFGVRAETEIQLQAISRAEDGGEGRSEVTPYTTSTPPFEGARFELSNHDPDRAQPGWTLTNLVLGSTLAPTIAVMLDEEGQPIWYHRMGDGVGSGDVEVSLVDGDDPANQRVLIGGGVAAYASPREVDMAGRVIWEGPQQPEGLFAEGGMHHSFRRTDAGTYLALRYAFDGQQLFDRVDELDTEGEAVWSWRSIDHTGALGDDYPHGNNAMLGSDGDTVYFSSRYTSSLFKLDRDSGDVLWRLGEDGDFAFEGEHATPWFLQAHARQLLPGGGVLLYDNGAVDEREWSRAVEYAVDEDTMTASIAWEYPGELAEDDWFTFAWGDADRLENGNTLICAGTLVGRQSQSRLFEVTAEGDKVWQVLLSVNDEEELAGDYMAQRIPVLLEEL
jgi:hypothetical protein